MPHATLLTKLRDEISEEPSQSKHHHRVSQVSLDKTHRSRRKWPSSFLDLRMLVVVYTLPDRFSKKNKICPGAKQIPSPYLV